MNLGIMGAGEQANELLSLFNNSDYVGEKYEKVILVDLEADAEHGIISEKEFFERPMEEYAVLVAMGEPTLRAKMHRKFCKRGYKFATYIHSSAIIGANSIVKAGSIILPFVYIAQDCIIGENTLVHTGARIENNCKIGNNCMISSGAFVGAKSQIGDVAFVGPNATIKDRLLIGNNVIIGMGSCVIQNIEKGSVVAGNPARFIRGNITGKVF